MASHVLVTPPAQEPLTIDEIRRHLRVDDLNAEPSPDAPTVALAGAGAGNVDNGAHRYRLTFVTADGETDGGTISAAVTVADKTTNGKVALSAISLGGNRVTSRKLYRTTAGGSTYLLVASIADNTTTTYTDNTADASLGAAIPSANTTLDPEFLDLQTTARQRIEEECSRAFLTQTWRYTLDGFPGCYSPYSGWPSMDPSSTISWPFGSGYTPDWSRLDLIEIPRPRLQSVTSITYIDTSGVQQTLSTSVYDVDTDHDPGRVVLKYGQAWPVTRTQRNAVVINYLAGYASPALVPMRWKHALKLLIGHWYVNRDLAGPASIMPEAVWNLMAPEVSVQMA